MLFAHKVSAKDSSNEDGLCSFGDERRWGLCRVDLMSNYELDRLVIVGIPNEATTTRAKLIN